MKRTVIFTIVTTACILMVGGCKKTNSETYLGVAVSEIDSSLNQLLTTYYPRLIDSVYGGYITNFENDWTPSDDRNKMLVTQARGLWTAARASEIFPENQVYRTSADHGFKFLTQEMWDTVKGGFFQNYYPDSTVKADHSYKLTYGNAFALYGLAQYAKINSDPSVKEWVRKTFNWLENTLHDSVYRGYFNVAFPPSSADVKSNKMEWFGKSDWKDQNTSIHLLEALTAAYKVLPEEPVKLRLIEMLELVRDSMTTSEGYLHLFFNKEWKPFLLSDSSKNSIIRNPQFDHISFGHNIETAYLLIDASTALYGNPDSVTMRIAKKLIDHTLNYGFDKDYYGLFDKGYMFVPDSVEVIDSAKVWWAQAEAWHALALFSQLYPNETKYRDAFPKMWNYIQRELIDHTNGGWYNSGLDANPSTLKERKAHAWKGCYHDGRALMQVMLYAHEALKGKP